MEGEVAQYGQTVNSGVAEIDGRCFGKITHRNRYFTYPGTGCDCTQENLLVENKIVRIAVKWEPGENLP